MKKLICILIGIAGVFLVIEALLNTKKTASISVISSADGPTSIFLAGKVGKGPAGLTVICFLVISALGIILLLKKKR